MGTHALIAAELGTIHQGERALADKLTSATGPDMLVLADRGFFSFDLWRDYMATGTALLWRLSTTMHLEPITFLPDGSYLAEIVSGSVRGGRTRIALANVGGDLQLATHIPVRVIEYRVDDDATTSETFRLITTIVDPREASAHELAAAYHQRWELETTFREIETYLRVGKGIRSKTPELVQQEIWGLFVTHYAIRAFMSEAADTVEMDPDRLSFTRTLHILRRRITDPAVFSPQSPTQTT
jgi:hypothetical protein